MALDSQSKRMSAAGCGRPYMRATFPDATKAGPWRASVGLAYNGTAFAAAVAVLAAHSQIADVMHRNEVADVTHRNVIGLTHRNEITEI